MIADEIRCVLSKRIKLHANDDYATEQCWNEEIAILSRDITSTIAFLDNECTGEEFTWISEVFEEVAASTQSMNFIKCLYRVANKYSAETEQYYILNCIKYAEKYIKNANK